MSRFPLGLMLLLPVLGFSCASMTPPRQSLTGAGQYQPNSITEQTTGNSPRDISGGRAATPEIAKAVRSAPSAISSANPSDNPVLPPGYSGDPNVTPIQVDLGNSAPLVDFQRSKSIQVDKVNLADYVSTSQRKYQLSEAGLGKFRVLILGSIYGNEPESIALMDAVMQESSNFSQSPSYRFLFIRTPNPDGLEQHIRTNHRGVDLNRNFPSTWFTATPNRLTGPYPASEIETQNVMRILKSFQPHRVIHVRSSIGQRPLVLVNDKLAPSVPELKAKHPVDVGAFQGEFKAGSLEEFVSLRIGAELIALHLPPKGFQQLSSQELIELATGQFNATPTSDEQNSLAVNETKILADQQADSHQDVFPFSQPDGEKGYVELLPPPPTGEPFNNASQSTLTNDPRYYELPPPPPE